MAIQRSLIIVEGPHDVEFVGRLLTLQGLKRIRLAQDLDPFWEMLTRLTFPHKGDLLKRMPVPAFFASKDHSIAIRSAEGLSEIPLTVASYLAQLGELAGLGIILDADSKHTPSARHNWMLGQLVNEGVSYKFPKDPGAVSAGTPRCGIFVLPDNTSAGTLENVLLECGRTVYPEMLERAASFVQSCHEAAHSECRDLDKESHRNKAIIGAVANVMKPGRAVQTSIQDNQWISETTIDIPNVAKLRNFLFEIARLVTPTY